MTREHLQGRLDLIVATVLYGSDPFDVKGVVIIDEDEGEWWWQIEFGGRSPAIDLAYRRACWAVDRAPELKCTGEEFGDSSFAMSGATPMTVNHWPEVSDA